MVIIAYLSAGISQAATPNLMAAFFVKGKVGLKWGKVAGADEYLIFRKAPGEDFQQIGKVAEDRYFDTNVCCKVVKQLKQGHLVIPAANIVDPAINKIGILYGEGIGVPQHFVMAHKRMNLAAVKGYENANRFRDIIASKMTPAQIAEAQQLAREWISTPPA